MFIDNGIFDLRTKEGVLKAEKAFNLEGKLLPLWEASYGVAEFIMEVRCAHPSIVEP